MRYEGWRVGSVIQNLRKDKNMTAAQLSELVGVSVSHQGQVEQGAHRMSMDLLYKYADILETDANTILGLREKEEVRELDGISIDAMLSHVSSKKRKYLQEMFVQMIEKIPA